MSDLTGTTLGRYQITTRLGSNSLGHLYRAHDPGSGREVTLTVLDPHWADNTAFVKQLERDLAIMGQLRHRNIMAIYDFGQEGDRYVIVGEWLDGRTLAEELTARRSENNLMTLPEIAEIVDGISNAVDYARSQGLVPTDISPDNVMIVEGSRAVVTHFGVAGSQADESTTSTGMVTGTPTYFSPELVRGERPEPRSDVYSLGAVLYEMVTGAVPFEGDNAMAVLMKQVTEPPPRPRQISPETPEGIEQVLLKALNKAPEARYQNAGELTNQFRQAIGRREGSAVSKSARLDPREDTGLHMTIPREAPPPTTKTSEPAQAPQHASPSAAESDQPPVPAPEPEPMTGLQLSTLRLDVAVPEAVSLGRTFDVAVAVRQRTSPILKEVDLPQLRSGDVQVAFPASEPFVRLRVDINAPECDIHETDVHPFRLYRGQDSPVFYFQLTPRAAGDITIVVTVYQEDDWLGSARIKTVAREQVAGKVQVVVSSEPVSVDIEQSLRRQLMQHHANLLKLKEKAALYGAGEIPLILENQIEAEERSIAELEQALAALASAPGGG